METRFISALLATESYRVEGDQLPLTYPGGGLVFWAHNESAIDENAIYTAILREWDDGKGSYVLLDSSRFNQPSVSMKETLEFIQEHPHPGSEDDPFNLDPASLADFESKNASSSALNEIVHLVHQTFLIDETEIGVLFEEGSESGWGVFQERYQEAKGVFSLSHVGFNDAGDQALVNMGLGSEEFTGWSTSFLTNKMGNGNPESP